MYSDTKKVKIFWMKKIRLTKQGHAFKVYTSSYNAEIWNLFNTELQFKDTESAIKSKLRKY